jgi:flagellar hook protein FlgE
MSSLFCLGDKLGTLGDNIANVNTTGFRAGQVSFEDTLIEATNTGGVRLSPTGVKSDFSEGSVETSKIATNMAITGEGFFILRDPDETNLAYYTRAGEFSFNSDGYLINPRGYIVQGYQFDAQGTEGTVLADIQLALTTPAPTLWDPNPVSRLLSSPRASTKLTLNTNVDARSKEHSAGGLFGQWDATLSNPMDISAYELMSTQEIYDGLGDKHSIAVFFDKTSQSNIWEYLITAPPTGIGTAPDQGVLARGTITFNDDGIIGDISMENYQGGGWVAGTPNGNGYLAFQTPFTGAASIELDLGTEYAGGSWQPNGQTSTQYGNGSYTIFSNTDGYGEGNLTDFSVNAEGIIIGSFNNGVSSDLFRVGLANASDPSSSFKRIGYSLYQADPESVGSVTSASPGNSGLGMIMGGSLETSNVDIAEQFGDLIFTQRAFQANSKSMVAADEMLKTLIGLKR